MADQRWHRVLAHTADIGLRAAAPDRAGLFEEVASALAEVAADIGPTVRLESLPVEVFAEDLPALAFGWLNELIGLGEVRGEALARAEVLSVDAAAGGWMVRGRAWFAPYDGPHVRPRQQVKAATLHRLRVVEGSQGWMLEAYFDV